MERAMSVVVTGASGFLGGRVTELLLEQGRSVIALGRNESALSRLSALGATIGVGDLTDRAFLLQAIPEGATLIHCGALSSPWGTPAAFYRANVLGTQVLCSAALDRGVRRLVHISTPSIYVEKESKEGILESDPLPSQMINAYADSKLKAEAVVDSFLPLGLEGIILRPQGIFGPRDTAILPRLIRVAQKGFIPVMNEKVRIDLTYVDNVVSAIFKSLTAGPEAIGERFNITNGEPVDQLETLERLLGRLGYPTRRKVIPVERAWKIAGALEWFHRTFRLDHEPLLTRYSVCTLAYTRTLSIGKARKILGYDPRISMEEGLERTIPWFARSPS
jgi:nucleoside-diphosphate-sugar epimerase